MKFRKVYKLRWEEVNFKDVNKGDIIRMEKMNESDPYDETLILYVKSQPLAVNDHFNFEDIPYSMAERVEIERKKVTPVLPYAKGEKC